MNFLKITAVFFILSGNIFAAEPINDKNWRSHPEIMKIRKLCNEIELLDKEGKLKFEYKDCGEDLIIPGSLWIDAKGIIRKYRTTNGSGDTSSLTKYYYDEKGSLRFIYDEYVAVNGTAVDYRIYFDERGKQIYTKHTEQGPFGSSIEPPEKIKNPTEHFENICKE